MSQRIEDLEPHTQALCREFLNRCVLSTIAVKVTHTLRTLDEQAHLYAKGRTLPGEPCHHTSGVRPVGSCEQHPLGATVTRAMPGQSAHNYGMAFDVAFEGQTPYPAEDDPRWQEIGALGEAAGLSWGGPRGVGDRFTFDRPHFQRPDWREASRGQT